MGSVEVLSVMLISGFALVAVPALWILDAAVLSRRLRARGEENVQLSQERDEARKTEAAASDCLRLATPDIDVAKFYRNKISEMKDIFQSSQSLERQCQEIIFDNTWILLPDYEVVEGEFYKEKTLSKFIDCFFPESAMAASDRDQIDRPYGHDRFDLGGWVRVSGSLQPSYFRHDDKVLMLIELKRPSHRITRRDIEQTYGYAFNIMQWAPKKLWGSPIECLTIGGSVDDAVSDVHLRFGDNVHGAIRITPLSYERLILRAERLAMRFLRQAPSREIH